MDFDVFSVLYCRGYHMELVAVYTGLEIVCIDAHRWGFLKKFSSCLIGRMPHVKENRVGSLCPTILNGC